jgi:hypothetical protein
MQQDDWKRRLGKPRYVRLKLHKRRHKMNDATVSWMKSLTGTPTGYIVVWTVNGTAKSPITVPATNAGDFSGYSLDASNSLGVVFSPGDKIDATVQATDSINNLVSAVVSSTPPEVIIPSTPVAPGIPQNVTLVLS